MPERSISLDSPDHRQMVPAKDKHRVTAAFAPSIKAPDNTLLLPCIPAQIMDNASIPNQINDIAIGIPHFQ